MAFLWGCGFGNRFSEGFETAVGGSIESTSPLSGLYSARYSGFAGTPQGHVKRFASAGPGVVFARKRIKLETLPDVNNLILKLVGTNSLTATTQGGIRLNTDGTLTLIRSATAVSPNSASINDGLEHVIELSLDSTPASGSRVITARLDGVQFATSSAGVFTAPTYIATGGGLGSEAINAGSWLVDDITVHDNSGSDHNSWPGDTRFVYLRPTGQDVNGGGIPNWLVGGGGTAGQSNNYGRVNEEQADDGTTYNAKDTTITTQQQDSFPVDTPASKGVPSAANILMVAVGGRIGGNTNTAASGRDQRYLLKDTTTQLDSSIVGTAISGWAYHSAAAPNVYQLVSYTRPRDGAAWDLTELNSLKIGYREGNAALGLSRISQIWALVEYQVLTSTPKAGTDTGSGSESAAITAVGGADAGSGSDSGAVIASAGPPVNTSLPVISGYPTVGMHLVTSDGIWTASPTSFSYQWQRADDPAFTVNVTNIGANQNNYDPVLADVLKYIRVIVTATNASGSTPAAATRVGLVGRQLNTGIDGATAVCGNVAGIFVPGAVLPSGADTGHGIDTGSVSAVISTAAAQAGTGAESASVRTTVVATDRGTGSESATVSIANLPVHGFDTGSGAESGDVSATVPTPTPEPEPLPFLAEAEVRVFVCGEMGQKLYSELEPVTYADAENFNSLHTFLCAIGFQFEEAWQLVRDPIIDGQRIPGWSVIVDLDRTPNKALGWLAQFVGVTLDPSLSDERQRERIHDTDGWKRGSVAAFMAAAKTHLTGDRTVVMHERYTSPYRVLVVTRTYETPSPANVLNALVSQKPAGIVLEYYVAAGRTYLEVRDENVDYAAAKAAYADYETMRATRLTDVPATDPLVPSETLIPGGTLAPGG